MSCKWVCIATVGTGKEAIILCRTHSIPMWTFPWKYFRAEATDITHDGQLTCEEIQEAWAEILPLKGLYPTAEATPDERHWIQTLKLLHKG